MNKKLTLIILLAVMFTGFVAGCSSKPKEQKGDAQVVFLPNDFVEIRDGGKPFF